MDKEFKAIEKMTVDERKALKASYGRLLINPVTANGVGIFLRLFRDNPTYKDMFLQFKFTHDAHMMGSAELRKHGNLFMKALKNIVDAAEDNGKLKKELKTIAISHKSHSVGRRHLQNMEKSVVESIEEEGPVSEDERKAWNAIYSCIADIIEHK